MRDVGYRHMGKNELSPRQLDTLALLADGHTDKGIARVLQIGETTAKRHVRDILSKLDATNRAHAVSIAYRKGLLG